MVDKPDDLEAALAELAEKWDKRVHESAAHAVKMRVGNSHHSYYYRGIADGYRAALADLRALFAGLPEDRTSLEQSSEMFAAVSRDFVVAALERVGLAISDLHIHADSTFSVILSPLQVLSFEDRIARLNGIADISVLSYGMLPDSSKAYIDFAFRSPPE